MVVLATPARDATSSMDSPCRPRSARSSVAARKIARSASSLRGRPRLADADGAGAAGGILRVSMRLEHSVNLKTRRSVSYSRPGQDNDQATAGPARPDLDPSPFPGHDRGPRRWDRGPGSGPTRFRGRGLSLPG